MTATETHRAIDAVWRIELPRLIAGLARIVRDVGLAEELAQDSLVAALERWPETGVPERPGAWLMATSEGWGLYAESLGRELGLYEDPYQYFGMLEAELWRAIRLVVDTGLHSKGWTREQVLEYMDAMSSTAEARAVSEAERYIAIPGQALAYKIGQLKIRELRSRAEAELNGGFDVRQFHTAVLGDGALPLHVLETKIERWIDERERSTAGAGT